MRLYASVIKLTNQYPATLTHVGGQHAHAAFLDIVRAVDAPLAQKLHDLNGRKPFTVSPLMGLPKGFHREIREASQGDQKRNSAVKHEIRLRQGWECWLRVTMLDDVLFKSFIDYFMNLPSLLRSSSPSGREGRGEEKQPTIRFGDAHFLVSEILTTPGSHPWAGYVSVEELQKRLDEPAPLSISFEFHSPVSFRLQGKDLELIPYPKLVFGNLATAWKALTGEDVVEAVEKYAAQHLRLVAHRLERKALTLHNQPQLGTVGRVAYEFIDPQDTPLGRTLNLLADLAFYAGLGRKTAQGMGMVRRIDPQKGGTHE